MNRVQSAIEQANKWVDVATPLVAEFSRLEEVLDNLQQASRKASAPSYKSNTLSRTYDKAARAVEIARNEIGYIIDDIRENALCDVNFYTDRDAPANVEEQNEADNNMVRSTVVSFDTILQPK